MEAKDIFESLLQGRIIQVLSDVFRTALETFSDQAHSVKQLFLMLCVVGFLAAFIMYFTEILGVSKVSSLGIHFCFLAYADILLEAYKDMAGTAENTIINIADFIRLMMPALLVSVGVTVGQTGAAAACQLLLLVIYGAEKLLLLFVLPMIYCYSVLVMINGVWQEERLGILIGTLRKSIGWIIKGLLGFVAGISLFQSLITPVMGAARNSILQRILGMLPGVGNLTENTADLLLGSAVLIRNSIGAYMMIALCLLVAFPMLKIALTAAVIKAAAAFVGIVSDRKMCVCVSRMGDAGFMLVKTTGVCIVLFFVVLAAVSASVKI